MLQPFVPSHVFFEMLTRIKTSPADLTVVRIIPGVKLHMLFQMTLRRVTLITLGAGKSVAIFSTSALLLIPTFPRLVLLHNKNDS